MNDHDREALVSGKISFDHFQKIVVDEEARRLKAKLVKKDLKVQKKAAKQLRKVEKKSAKQAKVAAKRDSKKPVKTVKPAKTAYAAQKDAAISDKLAAMKSDTTLDMNSAF